MELIKVWRKSGFTLRMWDTFTRDWRGQTKIKYELKDHRRVIFTGDDFSCSPLHCDDSPESVVSILVGFCRSQNGRFDTYRFRSYINGECGPCGGAIKK